MEVAWPETLCLQCYSSPSSKTTTS
jgi:hypothetical protein